MGMIYRQKMKIPFDMSDINGFIKVPQLLLLSLEVASNQSQSLGIGDKDLFEKHHLVWIVTDYDIQIQGLPSFDDEIIIETEALSYNRLFCYRRFSIFDQKGNSLVEMLATFVLMDQTTRKAQAVDPELVAPYESSFSKKIYRGPRYSPLKNPSSQDFQVRFYDLDMNGHVNNSKYLDWIFEVMGTTFLKDHIPEQIHLKYVREVRADGLVTSSFELDGLESRHQILADEEIKAQALVTWRKIKWENQD